MTYTHLLFDLDHTLLDFDRAEDLALNYLLEEAGVASQGPLYSHEPFHVGRPQSWFNH